LSNVQEGVLALHVRMQSDDEIERLDLYLQGLNSSCGSPTKHHEENGPDAGGVAQRDRAAADNQNVDLVESVLPPFASTLDRALDVGVSLLEGMVDSAHAFPFTALDQIRRSLVRDILRKCESLEELRRHRAIILPQHGTA
jgi:hypothetical protein